MKTRIKITERNNGEIQYTPQYVTMSFIEGCKTLFDSWYSIIFIICFPLSILFVFLISRSWYDIGGGMMDHDPIHYSSLKDAQYRIDLFWENQNEQIKEEKKIEANKILEKVKKTTYQKYP